MNILRTSHELTTVEKYRLTLAPATQKMKDRKGTRLEVKAWALYEDEKPGKPNPDTGEVVMKRETVLAIQQPDNSVFATNSATFTRDFLAMWDMFANDGEKVGAVEVIGGKSKNDRDFITCTYAE